MSDFQADGWAENPFTFCDVRPIPIVDGVPFPMTEVLRDLFEKIKVKYLRMPPAKINPLEPVATTQWSPEMGMSQTLADRFAPNPAFIGLPLKRKDIETTQGTKGFNTHYNIMIDQSGSMVLPAATLEDGTKLHRGLACRMATANLLAQAKLNTDSFTVFSYNNIGQVLIDKAADGAPCFNHDEAINFLTSGGNKEIWNPLQHKSSQGLGTYGDTANLINAMEAIVPSGGNNETSAFECMVQNNIKHELTGCITVFITDGDSLDQPLKEVSPTGITGGKTYDQWLRTSFPGNKVFYILIRDADEQSTMKTQKERVIKSLMSKENGNYPREIAEKFVWTFPDERMKDPVTGDLITDLWDQMGWLFTEIGKIFAGISEEFADVEVYLEDNPDVTSSSES